MEKAETTEKKFTVTSRQHGHAHTKIQGTYEGPVTVGDVCAKYYHTYFGGRDAWAKDGKFGCIIHTD